MKKIVVESYKSYEFKTRVLVSIDGHEVNLTEDEAFDLFEALRLVLEASDGA